MSDWEEEVDLVVVGSGGGGMASAITARMEGLETLLVEKTPFYGGSTAISGGGIWIPNNYLMAESGIEDSFEKARTYMANTVGDRTPKEKQDAFLQNAPKMVDYLSKLQYIEFQIMPGFSDYYPERPGGTNGGRGVDMPVFSGKKLGPLLKGMRPRPLQVPFGFVFTIDEVKKLFLYKAHPVSVLSMFKPLLRNLYNLITRQRHLDCGAALIGRLRMSMHELGIPLWLNSPLKEFVFDDQKVVGVIVENEGRPIRIKVRKGVVLAAGGFPHNQAMREKYQVHPVSTEWTCAADGNTGEVIEMGITAGADTDLMDDNWGMPVTLPTDQPTFPFVMERSYPGAMIVNSAGRRFTNEAASYVDVSRAMRENNSEAVTSIPSWFIMDNRFRSRYFLGTQMPGYTPKSYFETGFLHKADTIEELADKIGVDKTGLVDEVKKHGDYARTGKDKDFGRGDSAYDRYYSDPTGKPNCCLGAIQKPPYYAFKVYPGDIGTKGGLVTDENARVLNKQGDVIEGLYAIGNTSASVMGNTYPGSGSTIGPSMTFGYIAAMHAAGSVSN